MIPSIEISQTPEPNEAQNEKNALVTAPGPRRGESGFNKRTACKPEPWSGDLTARKMND